MRRALLLFILLMLLAGVEPASAHANLLRSDPPANAVLASAPQTISLWFTESLEPDFSHATLLDNHGDTVSTPPSSVDPNDSKHLTLAPGKLADGVYTVSWRAVSATDGHATSGSFAFAVGAVLGEAALAAPDTETIPPLSAPVRWLDLLSLTMAVGSVAFAVCVSCAPPQERRMRRLMGIGWLLVAISALVLLLYQATQETNASLIASLPALGAILTGTRFGALWIARMVVWGVMGVAVLRRRYRIALAAGLVLLLIYALYSHATATYDLIPALASDWLHLAATALWVGGLIQLANVLFALRSSGQPLAPLVARFSNYARLCVAVLIVTGLYAAWLEVGSVGALLNSLYGRALLVKLILFAPLLLIAAVNLLLTPRGLRARNPVWAKRLRGLVGAEIALTLGIFAAVAVMTSADPARASLASRLPPPDHTFADYQIVDDIHIHLDVIPGWVGQNQFVITLLEVRRWQFGGQRLADPRALHRPEPERRAERSPPDVGGQRRVQNLRGEPERAGDVAGAGDGRATGQVRFARGFHARHAASPGSAGAGHEPAARRAAVGAADRGAGAAGGRRNRGRAGEVHALPRDRAAGQRHADGGRDPADRGGGLTGRH